MMTVQTIMAELEAKGNESTKRILLKHGMKEPLFGVKVEDLKVIQKKVKKNYALAKDLFATGNGDAMYLAGLIADETKMTKDDLQAWVKQANAPYISEYTVPWITTESRFGYELALEWIDDKNGCIASAGWSTLSNLVAYKPDDELDIQALKGLLMRVENTIHESENRVKFTMNGFVIAVGGFVVSLTDYATDIARKIGKISVDMNGTACKVPNAIDYIPKIQARMIGKKKKTVRC